MITKGYCLSGDHRLPPMYKNQRLCYSVACFNSHHGEVQISRASHLPIFISNMFKRFGCFCLLVVLSSWGWLADFSLTPEEAGRGQGWVGGGRRERGSRCGRGRGLLCRGPSPGCGPCWVCPPSALTLLFPAVSFSVPLSLSCCCCFYTFRLTGITRRKSVANLFKTTLNCLKTGLPSR